MRQNVCNGAIDRTDKIAWELKQSIIKKFKIMIAQVLVLAVLLIIFFFIFLGE